jgi:chromosome segregation ATPase
VIVVVSKSALDAGLKSDLLAGGRGAKSSGDYIEVKHEEEPLQTPELTIVRDEQYEDTGTPDTDLNGVIATLDGVAGDMTTLQSSLGELAGRLGEAAAGLGHARDEDRRRIAELTAQTDDLTRAREDDQRRIAELEARQAELEEFLSQRTQVGESLKAQLADLSRTLDGLG